ncbi:ABC-type glycerol-3-phosphate transport system, substrate-binding protein [Paenibacillus sp. yr247]|uniref:ABC transporter substrate-binding protein n=1 Tax=Paenibacillus sp. yr247 TaxID=1761880 RepID=UPI000880874D|nr:ABC transporter substrate-binding protein [Paenibacillus sp. yr247]SDO43134.1 ABC-type glycerol-3-phosphate transport system, substrate-binding protein [Paenibacillus sp. yr247]
MNNEKVQASTRGKKLVTLPLAATLALALTITGCSSSTNTASTGGDSKATDAKATDTKTADTKSSGAPVTIDFWFPWGGDYQKDFKANVVDVFEKQHPNIKVKMTFVETTGQTQASDKLLTAIAGGNPPDVALFDRFLIGSWAAKGSLTDLTAYVKGSGIKAEDYYKGLWAEAVYKDKVYALPWGTDTRAMYYNKTLMKEAGLDPNKPPQTLQELDQMAEKVFKKGSNGKYSQIGFIPWMNQGFFYTQAWNWGGKWEDGTHNLTPNDPQNVKALAWMADYAKKYDIGNLTSFSDAMGQTGMNPFWTGKVGFVFDGNWILNDLAKYKPTFEWGVAPMPAAEGAKPVTWAGGWSYVVPKGSKHEKEAWEFVNFVAHKEGTLLWAKRQNAGNDITAMPSVNDQLKLSDIPNLKVFLDGMPTAFTRPVSPAGAFLWNETMRVQDLAIHGKGDAQALLDEVKKNVDAELAKQSK